MGGPPLTYPPLLSYSSVSAGLRLFPPTLIDNIHRIDVPRVSLNAWIWFWYTPSPSPPALIMCCITQMSINVHEIFEASYKTIICMFAWQFWHYLNHRGVFNLSQHNVATAGAISGHPLRYTDFFHSYFTYSIFCKHRACARCIITVVLASTSPPEIFLFYCSFLLLSLTIGPARWYNVLEWCSPLFYIIFC